VIRFLVGAAMVLAVSGALAADGHSITVSATVLSKSNCRFATAASTITLNIDPSSGAAAAASGTVAIRCQGSAPTASWSLSAGTGLHGSSPTTLRLRHATHLMEYLPYSLASPASGSVPKNVWQNVTLTATVSPADFQNASSGAYSDAVTLSLLP
jgi:hypothetical protein